VTTPSPFLRFWTAEITIFRQTAMVGQISNLSMPEIIQKLDLQDRGDRPLSTKERDPEEQRGHDRLLCAAKGVVRRCSPGSINCLVRGIEGQVYLVLVEITCLNPCRDLM
jgi:hypothetical protein